MKMIMKMNINIKNLTIYEPNGANSNDNDNDSLFPLIPSLIYYYYYPILVLVPNA